MKQLKFNITPTDENVNNIRIYMGTNKDEPILMSPGTSPSAPSHRLYTSCVSSLLVPI